jgi:TnpA family transposase
VNLQLNRGESRHSLTGCLFANQGDFRTGDREEMMNTVSALSLLSNAVLVWNTVSIAEIVRDLERSVDRPVRPEVLPRVSPLWSGHVIASGTYHVRGEP